jgi:hypothetical protein
MMVYLPGTNPGVGTSPSSSLDLMQVVAPKIYIEKMRVLRDEIEMQLIEEKGLI